MSASGRLTTHVLDVRLGQPARDLAYALFRLDGSDRGEICRGVTNHDGRAVAPLLEGTTMLPGCYEIVFAAGDYQRRLLSGEAAGFYDLIPIRFAIADPAAHYHVPLLLSPFGYSTYRGS
jgi:5-hydroxyisourate hydrolase